MGRPLAFHGLPMDFPMGVDRVEPVPPGGGGPGGTGPFRAADRVEPVPPGRRTGWNWSLQGVDRVEPVPPWGGGPGGTGPSMGWWTGWNRSLHGRLCSIACNCCRKRLSGRLDIRGLLR